MSERSRRAAAVTLSVAAHAAALFVAVRAAPDPPVAIDPAPMVVQLVTPPPPEPPPPVEADPTPEPAAAAPIPKPEPKPPPRRIVARPTPAPPASVPPVPAAREAGVGEYDGAGEVSDAEIAGAATAGSGGSGGGCDMPALVQRALRRDRQVRTAVAEVDRGKALRVWNGDWVRHRGQEGAGLAAVREAITWEVAWAPEACRHQRMSGPVVLSLADTPGAARIVVGGGQWRWSDLLFARGERASRR
ncbi:hypothetical protein DJ019_16870 [Phenylobacterium kunshanense]|uniref:Uncharacterized protein n=1 Tax=Phenylobacterium kunshanense TaxID=1445034 RepID=A0A328B9R6_9CAUL|nr:hypothetical protein DJ019_16870 [Phenylobacterium kunshanense]